MGMGHEARRDFFEQRLFNGQNCFAIGHTGPVAQPEDMGIDRHGMLTPGDIAHHIGCFAPDTGQCFECFLIVGYDPAMFFNKDLGCGHDILGLAAIKPDGLDVLDQGLFAKVEHILRGFDDLKQLFGRLVHPDIGGLRRKCNRDQKGVGIGVVELPFGSGSASERRWKNSSIAALFIGRAMD